MTSLLERTDSIETLQTLLSGAAAGKGGLVIVSGEAGIGKSALLRQYLASQNNVLVLFGYCEATETARTFGPVHDIALQLPGALRAGLSSSSKPWHLYEALLDDLATLEALPILCIEDIHWADQATLEFLRFLGRRCALHKLLVLLTLREFEPESARARASIHSSLPIDQQHEIRLNRLSETAVQLMAQAGGYGRPGLFELTGGNPLFVACALRWRDGEAPESLRHLVRQRLHTLPQRAQRLILSLSVHPERIEQSLMRALPEFDEPTLALCQSQNWLVLQGGCWQFEHEMVRLAVLADLSGNDRRALHAEMLNRSLPLAQRVHHALHAQALDVLREAAPAAARAAFAANSYREAVSFWQIALERANPSAQLQAQWLDSIAWALIQVGELDRAFDCCRRARSIWLEAGNADAILRNMSSTLRMAFLLRATTHWFTTDEVNSALALEERVSQSFDRAILWFYLAEGSAKQGDFEGARARLEMLGKYRDSTVSSAEVTEILWWVSTLEFSFMLSVPEQSAESVLHESLRIGNDLLAAQCWILLIGIADNSCDLARARKHLAEGLEHCANRDLIGPMTVLQGFELRLLLQAGEYARAIEASDRLVAQKTVSYLSESFWHLVRGLAIARTSGESAMPLLLRGLELMEKVDLPIGRAVALRYVIEAHWLAGDLAGARQFASKALALIEHCRVPWMLGQIHFWAWRIGHAGPSVRPDIPIEYRRMMAGQWREAAQAWRARELPYETALACAAGDAKARSEAVAILKRLNAQVTLARLREQWASEGIKSLPRGINAATRNNPNGLTNREWQLLALVAQDMSNAAIAEHLNRSIRTIEHHIASALAKLNVRSRQQATQWFLEHQKRAAEKIGRRQGKYR